MPFLPGKVSFWRPLADYRAPDGGAPHAAASGDEAISTCGMTAEEDKKTPARVGRVPGLILAQRWGSPSLADGVLPYLTAARHRAVVVRILRKMVITLSVYLLRGSISITAPLFKRGWHFVARFLHFCCRWTMGIVFAVCPGQGLVCFSISMGQSCRISSMRMTSSA